MYGQKQNQFDNDQRRFYDVLFSSISASTITTILTNPLEIFKLRKQRQCITCTFYGTQQKCELCVPTNFRKIIKLPLNYWFKGLSLHIPMICYSNLIFFEIYQNLRKSIISITQCHNDNMYANFSSALISRSIVTTTLAPIQAKRVQMGLGIISHDLKRFPGFKPMFMRDIVFSVIYWPSIQAFRNYLNRHDYRSNNNKTYTDILFNNIIAGSIVGAICSLITTPLDTIKTRQQSNAYFNKKSIYQTLKYIKRKEGIMGLFAGVKPRVLKSVVHSSSILFFYEYFIALLKRKQ